MQVTEVLSEGLRRSYTITVTAAELDAKVTEKLVEAQPEIAMKGFRKGKVPMPLLRKHFGRRLLGDAMQEAIDAAVKSHFDATGERPALQPRIAMKNGETWSEGQDVVVEMTYEALPAIPEVDLSGIALERLVVAADDEAVARAMENLAAAAREFEDRAEGAAAENGDQVVIDFVGRVDGVAFEGGAATDYPLTLGAGSFIPGFEEQLVGARVGEDREVTVRFPEDYNAAHLAGKEAVFACTVKAVKAPKAAVIDDALAQKFGAESVEALRAQVVERIEAEFKDAARAVMKRALLDKLDSLVSFDLPPSLVEAEARQIAHQLWHEEHPDVQGHNHPEIEPTDEHKALAVRRVRLGLLLAEIGRRAGIEVTDAEMTQAVIAQARQFPGQERQFFDFVRKNPSARQQIRAPLFEDKVVDHIFSLAAVTDRAATKADLEAAVQALDAV